MFPLFCPPSACMSPHDDDDELNITKIHTATSDDITTHRHTLRSWLTCCRLSGTGLQSEFTGGHHLDRAVFSIHSAGFSHTVHVDKQHGDGHITWLRLIQNLKCSKIYILLSLSVIYNSFIWWAASKTTVKLKNSQRFFGLNIHLFNIFCFLGEIVQYFLF